MPAVPAPNAAPDAAAPAVPEAPDENTPERVWREAASRGVTFRASGSEPGWIVEVHPREGFKAVLDYGADSVVSSQPVADRRSDGSLVYTADADGRSVRVTATAEPCEDAMSGARHTHTVRMTVDTRLYVGCGRSY